MLHSLALRAVVVINNYFLAAVSFNFTKSNRTSQIATMSAQHESSSNPYLFEQVYLMIQKESTMYKLSRDYFRFARSDREVEISPCTRKAMITWAFQIVESCKLKREVAIKAIGYFDRFLSNSRCQSAEAALQAEYDFQLCFIACMFIAIKTCAGMRVDLNFLSEVVCQGLYDTKELSEMEMNVLKGLGWRLNGPTAMDFVHSFIQMMLPQEKSTLDAIITRKAEALVEAAVMDYSMALQQPSLIAVSSILVAADSLDVSYFNPLDKTKWMESIARITLKGSDISCEVSATDVDETIY